MKTLSELNRFVETCSMYGHGVPENLFIVSPEIIEEAYQMLGMVEWLKDGVGIKVFGVNVIRDFAEVVPQINNNPI